MKFINSLLFLLLVFCVGCKSNNNLIESFPGYRTIGRFSKRLNEKTGIVLSCYGTTIHPSKEHLQRYGKQMFRVTYYVPKNQQDVISLEEARCLLVSIVESFLEEINTDPELRKILDVYPVTYDWIEVNIHFKDRNKVDIGSGGISNLYFWSEKIRYETYKISKYTGKYPAEGRHTIVKEESYKDALEIVKQQGCLQQF